MKVYIEAKLSDGVELTRKDVRDIEVYLRKKNLEVISITRQAGEYELFHSKEMGCDAPSWYEHG